VIATHFWYPPQLIPLVEVCAGPQTSRAVLGRTVELIRGAGKGAVVIDKEVPRLHRQPHSVRGTS